LDERQTMKKIKKKKRIEQQKQREKWTTDTPWLKWL
jgi:hypothetical protein